MQHCQSLRSTSIEAHERSIHQIIINLTRRVGSGIVGSRGWGGQAGGTFRLAGLLGGVLHAPGARGGADLSGTQARARVTHPCGGHPFAGKLHHPFWGRVDGRDRGAHSCPGGSGPAVGKTGSISAVNDQLIFRTARIAQRTGQIGEGAAVDTTHGAGADCSGPTPTTTVATTALFRLFTRLSFGGRHFEYFVLQMRLVLAGIPIELGSTDHLIQPNRWRP